MNLTYSGLVDVVVASDEMTVTSVSRQTHLGRTLNVSYGETANRVVSDIEINNASASRPWMGVRDAAWDTGSGMSAIDTSLAKELDLEQVDDTYVATMAGTVPASQYYVTIRVAHGMEVGPIRVNGIDMSGRPDGLRVLLGMDVISRGRLTVETSGGVTHMEFTLPEERR